MAPKRRRPSGTTYHSPPKRHKQERDSEPQEDIHNEDLQVTSTGTQTEPLASLQADRRETPGMSQSSSDNSPDAQLGKTRQPKSNALALRRLKLLNTLESLTQASIEMVGQCSVAELVELSRVASESDIASYWSELNGVLRRTARLEGVLDNEFQLRSQCLRHIPQKQWPTVRKTLITLAISVLLRPDTKSLDTLHDQMYDIFLGNSSPRAWHFSLFHAVKMQRLRLHLPKPSAEVVNHTLPLDPENELRVKLGRMSSDRLGPMESIYIEHCKSSRRALLEHGVQHALEHEGWAISRPEVSAQLISETVNEEIIPFFNALSSTDSKPQSTAAEAAPRPLNNKETLPDPAQNATTTQMSMEEDEDDEEAFLKMARFAANAALQESSHETEVVEKAAAQAMADRIQGSSSVAGMDGNAPSSPSSSPIFSNYVPGMVNANGESIHEQYERARMQATLKAHQSRPGDPNGNAGRRPWSPEEEQALMQGLSHVKGPHWSQILAMYGANGSINEVLKNRSQVQLKDKARNLKLFFLKNDMDVPPYLKHVTGELQKRAYRRGGREDGSNERSASEEQPNMDTGILQPIESAAPEIAI